MTEIDHAARLLREGKLVTFPTETVYGLGADATNPIAVQRIFDAKGRPATNPLIVHVADATAARRYVTQWPAAADKLAALFWPGPLTLVLPKAEKIVPLVTAGLSSVGLRVPDHPVALELLRAFDGAVAAPSANRSNHVSPTEAEHVRREMGDSVDLILDGGRSRVGIESTVLDLSGSVPTILRPGGVTREQIEAAIGTVALYSGAVPTADSAKSPGQQERHYSPRTSAYRFEAAQGALVARRAQSRAAAMTITENLPAPIETIRMPSEATAYATELYATLRRLDTGGYGAIFIEMPPDLPQWAAVRDRIFRATLSV